MLISHDYKFIFIKTKKTAGSSLETYLKPYCKNGFIGERLKEEHLTAQEVKKMVGEEKWESYLKIVPIRNPWDQTVSLYFWRKRERPFYYYLYRWFIQLRFRRLIEHHLTFAEWVHKKWSWVNENRDIMYIDGQLDDYQFIRFENLAEDLKKVCARLEIPFDPNGLPHEKAGHRPKTAYRAHYNEETKKIVSQAYDLEIEEFGYKF